MKITNRLPDLLTYVPYDKYNLYFIRKLDVFEEMLQESLNRRHAYKIMRGKARSYYSFIIKNIIPRQYDAIVRWTTAQDIHTKALGDSFLSTDNAARLIFQAKKDLEHANKVFGEALEKVKNDIKIVKQRRKVERAAYARSLKKGHFDIARRSVTKTEKEWKALAREYKLQTKSQKGEL